MNRAEFMGRLTELLSDVSPMERDEAIQYYNDYFDDAGAENESGVIASLGTPEELARTIKAGLSDGGNGGEFTESGFSGYAQVHRDEMIRAGETGRTSGTNGTDNRTGGLNGTDGKAAGADRGSRQSGNTYYQEGYYQRTGGDGIYGGREDKRKYDNPYGQTSGTSTSGGQSASQNNGMSGGTIVLIIILAVLTSPIWIGLLGGLAGVVIGLLATLLGVFLAFLAAGVGLLIASLALLITGFAMMFSTPLAGLCLIGSAMIVFALGLVFIWLMVLIAGIVIPALIRGIAALGQRLFHRGGAQA